MSENTLKLEKKVFITGEIIVRTGLHIGGSSLGLSIGGADKVVVRNPITNLPYVPGSSLKGKMRSLLEKTHQLVELREEEKEKDNKKEKLWTGSLCLKPDKPIVQLFGSPADALGVASKNYVPTRLTVRDGALLNEPALAVAENTDMYCTEVKTEVYIDRLTSAANPRNFERVPAGARFKLDLILDIYNVDTVKGSDEKEQAENFIALIREGLMLVEDSNLGGHGSRGYGQVEFRINPVTERTAQSYRDGNAARQASDYDEYFQSFREQATTEA